MVIFHGEIFCNCCFFILCFIITSLLIKIFFSKNKINSSLRLPPSPPSLPIIGHLHHFLSPPLFKSFHKLSLKYGPLLHLRLGATPCLLVSSASTASEIFKTHDLAFSSRPNFAFSDKISYTSAGFINAPFGEYWRFIKNLLVAELLGPRQIKRSKEIRREEMLRFIEGITNCSKQNRFVEVGNEVMNLTNNVVCRMAMSTRCSENESQAEECRKLVKQTFELASKLCFGEVLGPFKWVTYWLYGKKSVDLTARFDDLLESVLKEHEQYRRERDAEDMDMMDVLLKIHHEDNAPVRITRTNIKALLVDLFIAGTDTASDTIQWALAELINHPCIFKKVREEIETIVGISKLVEESDVPNLPYLQEVVKETLRLHPSAPLTTRECRQQCKVAGYDVPEKMSVAVNLYSIMRDPNVWDDPDTFRPERFLATRGEDEGKEDAKDIMGKGQSYGFVPFGGGRRGCPGSLLAFTLIHFAIAAMVQCFDWKVGDGDGERVDMEPGSGLTMGMAHPLICLPIIHLDPFVSNQSIPHLHD